MKWPRSKVYICLILNTVLLPKWSTAVFLFSDSCSWVQTNRTLTSNESGCAPNATAKAPIWPTTITNFALQFVTLSCILLAYYTGWIVWKLGFSHSYPKAQNKLRILRVCKVQRTVHVTRIVSSEQYAHTIYAHHLIFVNTIFFAINLFYSNLMFRKVNLFHRPLFQSRKLNLKTLNNNKIAETATPLGAHIYKRL